ncbi:MAG: DUF1559 domain-containing protein [Opitutaceae bacterium]|nr:DUF1559 domain-containing protein [Opitutaceae bacterium]
MIELLTVIAIIGILAAIIIPVVGKARASADAARCISNLRQIGTANIAYANDNRDQLPGGLNLFQGAWGNRASTGSLAAFLAPYMAESFSGWTNHLAKNVVCPAWLKVTTPAANGDLNQALYHMNPEKITGTAEDVWMGTGGGRDPAHPDSPTNRHTYTQATQESGASRTWMLIEIDWKLPPSFSGVQVASVVKEPVHGSFRNKLYMDAHVVREPVQ